MTAPARYRYARPGQPDAIGAGAVSSVSTSGRRQSAGREQRKSSSSELRGAVARATSAGQPFIQPIGQFASDRFGARSSGRQAIACPPPATSRPASRAAIIAAPRSTPAMERPEPFPLPASSASSAITMRGLSGLFLDPPGNNADHARMPALTGQERSYGAIMLPASMCFGFFLDILPRFDRRSSFSASSSAAIARASSGSCVVSRRTPSVGFAHTPTRIDARPQRKAEIAARGCAVSGGWQSISAASPTFCAVQPSP
jgi:hypothetical protein